MKSLFIGALVLLVHDMLTLLSNTHEGIQFLKTLFIVNSCLLAAMEIGNGQASESCAQFELKKLKKYLIQGIGVV